MPAFLFVLVAASAYRMGDPAPAGPGASTDSDADRMVLRGKTMGTTFTVTLAARPDGDGTLALIEAELAAVDDAMSTYKADSELSRLNRADGGVELPVSDPLREVLGVALDIGRRSGGALDIAIGPLVDAWGFGPADAGTAPSAQRLESLRRLHGQGAIVLGQGGVTKRATAVVCDLSSVAKGYAVDRVAAALEGAGHRSFLIEVGGEMRARGRRPGGALWRVGIERPVTDRREVLRALPLLDMAMATSGDYRNFREFGDGRVSHIIDPRTGRPAVSALASVTVLHAEAAVADAWATALTVLGPSEGLKLANAEGLGVLFVVRAAQGELRSMESEAFARYIVETSQ